MPQSRYGDSVFINSPFDADYYPLFNAIVFAVQDCGFLARCALEVEDSGAVRIEKIARIISECKFGVHDISRTELDSRYHLPRFNMPLELGLFLGAARFGGKRQKEKLCLILDRERFRYQKFCSDIAGQDISVHRDEPETAIKVVRNWLAAAVADILPGGTRIADRYKLFQDQLPVICGTFYLRVDELTFIDFRNMVIEWLKENR